MRILFLHGWNSVVGGVKPSFLAAQGHEIANPALPHEDFAAALVVAQQQFDEFQPQVVIGSSRGGAVAMNLIASGAGLVLLCPAWKRWGTVSQVPTGTVILHSRADDVIPFADSEQLVRNSHLLASSLVEVGHDHRLADPASLAAMMHAAESWLKGSG